jgi:small subunit ribosomal protein S20
MATKRKEELPSAKKDIERNLRNIHHKTMVKTQIKKLTQVIEAKNFNEAKEILRKTQSLVDHIKSKNALHWKTAGRKVSRLTAQYNQAFSSTQASNTNLSKN